MAKYKVIGVKREVGEGDSKTVVFDQVEMTNQVGLAKGKVFKWDPGSEVTEKQVSDDEAKKLVEEGKLEVIEAPASWVEKKPE